MEENAAREAHNKAKDAVLKYKTSGGDITGQQYQHLNDVREAALERLSAAMAVTNAASGNILSAPFVTKTEAWVALALKRMIRHAAENGFDRIAWTNGEQQGERYDLSRHVSNIGWSIGPKRGLYNVGADDREGRTVISEFYEGRIHVGGAAQWRGQSNRGRVLVERRQVSSEGGLYVHVWPV